METTIMSTMLASLIALTNAQLESMKPMTLPTLMPLVKLPTLPGLASLSNLQDLNNFVSGAQGGDALEEKQEKVPCTCGVFLSGQFKRGSQQQPTGNAALLQELIEPLQCNAVGEKQCINKCLETMVRHLPSSGPMICGSIDRDCHKERAYLFVKNCKDIWINSNLSAGREYCCKDGLPYKCPNAL